MHMQLYQGYWSQMNISLHTTSSQQVSVDDVNHLADELKTELFTILFDVYWIGSTIKSIASFSAVVVVVVISKLIIKWIN